MHGNERDEQGKTGGGDGLINEQGEKLRTVAVGEEITQRRGEGGKGDVDVHGGSRGEMAGLYALLPMHIAIANELALSVINNRLPDFFGHLGQIMFFIPFGKRKTINNRTHNNRQGNNQ